MSLLGVRQLVSQQNVEASDVMHCFLGLRNLEIDVYFYLLKGKATVREIAGGLGRNRSTIQRAIQNLVNRGISNRRTKTLRKGGYVYVYEGVSLPVLKALIKDSLDSFYEQVIRSLDRLWVESLKQ